MSDSHYIVEALSKVKSDEIERKVYSKIKDDLLKFKFVGGIVGLIIAIAVVFHQPIFSFIVAYGGSALKDEIKRSVSTEHDQLKSIVSEFALTRKLLDDDSVRNRGEISKHRSDVLSVRTEFDRQLADLQIEKKRLDETLASMKEMRDALVERVAAAQSTVQQLEAYMADSNQRVNSLISNQAGLAKELKTSVPDIALLPNPDEQKRNQSVSRSTTASSTVYFQFAGFNRQEAVAILGAIEQARSPSGSEQRWNIPGAERTPLAAGKNEIRYNRADRVLAEALAADVERALELKGFAKSVALTPNDRVREGVPELWLSK